MSEGMCIRKSTDAGLTWDLLEEFGTDYGACNAIAVAPSQSTVVYAVGNAYGEGRVYRSANAGADWQDVTGNLGTLAGDYWSPAAVLVHPDNANRVYVGAYAGVFLTTDGGATWSATGQIYSVSDLAFSPIQGETLEFQPTLSPGPSDDSIFAASRSGIYYSADSGANWTEIGDGMTVDNCLTLATDSVNNYLFAGTEGGGVWRISLGEPEASAGLIWTRYR